MNEVYDSIGRGYRRRRRPDPRIAAAIDGALEGAATVVNVGAGAGAYEPSDRTVLAIEPSLTMVRQRPAGAAPVVRASAAALPVHDGAFDAALAILTLHHWPDQPAGLRELRRVARDRVVILTWDPAGPAFWLADYLPEILSIDTRIFPSLDTLRGHLGRAAVRDVPIPHDCHDGFLGAYWRRPAAYLDPAVRSAISTFARLPVDAVDAGLGRLAADLQSGEWRRRHGAVLDRDTLDLGYRLVVA